MKIMGKRFQGNYFNHVALVVVLSCVCSLGLNAMNGNPSDSNPAKDDAKPMPVYGHWRNFTTKDGLPSNKAYAVRIDGKRVLVGTHEGLAVYEDGSGEHIQQKTDLPHNGVVSIDVSELTGDVWIGTLGGLSRWSAGKFENFTQLNSGMPNDLVYCVIL